MGSYIGKLFNQKRETRILIQGLDAAGKTTVLYRLKLGEVVTTIPTIGFNVETIEYKQVVLTAWDVGGRDKIRPLWRHYYQNTDALVYVVDSADHERLEQARDELMATLGEDELKDVIVAVMANKQDLPNAYSFTKIADELQLHSLRNRKWCIFPTSATKGEGLYEALEWLSVQIKWGRTKQAVTEPVVQSVKDAQKAVQEVGLSKMKTTGWHHLLHTWKSIFSWSQT